MRLLLIRHPAPLIAPGRCYGRLDVPVQPAALAQWLDTWDQGQHPTQPWMGYQRLASSPALRCQGLATALSVRVGLPLESDPAWLEMDFGTWENQSWDAIGKPAVDAWAADPMDHAPGGGESVWAMMLRVMAAYDAWREQKQDMILVCHGGIIRLLQAWHALPYAGPGPSRQARLRTACLRALGQSPPAPGGLVLLQ